MSKFIRIIKKIFSPHFAILAVLTPIVIALLICSLVYLEPEHPAAALSYALSAYTLAALCVRTPDIIRGIKSFKSNNSFASRFSGDVKFRTSVTLLVSLVYNTAYAVFQLALGFYHGSVWFYAMAAYYGMLAIMRASLAKYTVSHQPGKHRRSELLRYRLCGIILALMNSALVTIVFFIVWQNRTFVHHEIITITLAAYTFTSLVVAIVNVVQFRKYNSPVYSASKAVSLTAALVSMVTLTTTMLTTFGEAGQENFSRAMIAAIGGTVSMLVLAMAIGMIAVSTKELKLIKKKISERTYNINGKQ